MPSCTLGSVLCPVLVSLGLGERHAAGPGTASDLQPPAKEVHGVHSGRQGMQHEAANRFFLKSCHVWSQ